MRKSWNKPELTVLVRTRPEEAILGLCKNLDEPGGRENKNMQCIATETGGSPPCLGDCDLSPDS